MLGGLHVWYANCNGELTWRIALRVVTVVKTQPGDAAYITALAAYGEKQLVGKWSSVPRVSASYPPATKTTRTA